MTARRADNPPQTPRRGRGRPRKDATLAVGDPGVFAGSMAEDLARAVLQSLPAHLAVIEADGRVVAVNKAWEKFSQDLAETFEHPIALGENYLDALVDGRTFERSRREAALAGVNEILDRQRARFELEYPLVTKAETRWFLLSVTPLLGAEGGAVIAHLEMTDLKRAELAANEKTQVLQAVLDSTADGVVVADHTGEFLIFNRAAREIAGVGAIEAPTEQWSKMFGLFHEDRTTAFREEDLPLHLAVQGKSTDRVPMWVRNKEVPDGRMISVSGRPWSTPGGESNGGVVVFRDISQDAVSENRLRFQSGVLDAVPNAVLALDRDGTVVYWNRASEQLVGWSAVELIGKRGRDILLPAEDRARVDGIRAYVEGGGIFRGEFPAQRPDGTPVPILALASALRSVHGDLDGFVVVGVDLTDLRTTQEALRVREHEMRQFQKMEAIGRLAGGIAHDFNNLLTVIRGYMDILITRLEPGHPALEDARQVADAAERATALTAQLLAFGRRRPIQTALLQLNDVVKDFLPMLERTIGENIKVVADLAPDLSPVKADAGQLGQVLLNLALNARDAMPEGGTLTITSDHAELDVGYPGLHVPLTPGSYVRLSVTDTGIGMDEETRVRVFEPFFTTKGPGHGTGLGLATAYGIIRQLDGAIWVYSEPGHGTTFRIYLPRVFESFTAPIEAPPAPTPARGGEIVLLVEDEDAVRAVERKLLEAQGYRVLEAPSGAAALELLGEYDGRIDLLLSDVIMPGMNGREVADAVRKVRPGLRVLYVSGHSGEVMNRHGGLETGANFLNKPFSGAELTAAVRAAIDGPPGPSS